VDRISQDVHFSGRSTMIPPSKTLARLFVTACPDAFLRNDVLANEPESVSEALRLIITRLNDSGFLRSALAHANTRRPDRPPLPHNDHPPPPFRKFDGNGGGPAGGSTSITAPRPSQHHRDQRCSKDSRGPLPAVRDFRASALPPPAPEVPRGTTDKALPRPASSLACSRCRKSGHKDNACISKHDVDGNKLERQEADVYARRKEQARLDAAARQKVNAVSKVLDSDTEDLANGVFSISVFDDAIAIVPAPSLLLCGDVEPNPGPATRRNTVRRHRRECLRIIPLHVQSPVLLPPCSAFRSNPQLYNVSMAASPAFGFFAVIALLMLWSYTMTPSERGTVRQSRRSPPHSNEVWCESVTQLNAVWYHHFNNHVPHPSLLMDGDIESNPGPIHPAVSQPTLADTAGRRSPDPEPSQQAPHHRPQIVLSPSTLRKPSRALPKSFFSPSTEHVDGVFTVPPGRAIITTSTNSDVHTAQPSRSQSLSHSHDGSSSGSSISSEQTCTTSWSTVQAIFGLSSDSDTSDIDDAPVIASIGPPPMDDMLPPPKFNAFLVPIGTKNPPPLSSDQVCAIDTMCQGQYSVISRDVAQRLNLPCSPCNIRARTASGDIVECSSLASFTVAIFVLGAWINLPTQALVWNKTAEPVLLHNAFALATGLIDFVKPNNERVPIFGNAVFARNSKELILSHDASVLAAYHEDVLPEAVDDIIDLDAPLKCGDQDVSMLPPDAMVFAKRYPDMTRAMRQQFPGTRILPWLNGQRMYKRIRSHCTVGLKLTSRI
jgi:hypothetical protein